MMEISWKEAEKIKAVGGTVIKDIWNQSYVLWGEHIFRISVQPSDQPEYDNAQQSPG